MAKDYKSYEEQLDRLFAYLKAVYQAFPARRRRIHRFFDWDLDEEPAHEFDAQAWQDVAAERYMEARGLSDLERRLVRVLLLQAMMENASSFRPFCGRLSQLMPLLVSDSSSGEQFSVLQALLPTGRLCRTGIVAVQGALLGSDPQVRLTHEALSAMLGEAIFVLLGLEPLTRAQGEVPRELVQERTKGLLVTCGRPDAEVVAGALARLTGGSAWQAPRSLDVDELPEALLVAAFREYGGVLVLDAESDCGRLTRRRLSRQIPVLYLLKEAEKVQVQYPAASQTAAALASWLSSVVSGGDGMVEDTPVLLQS